MQWLTDGSAAHRLLPRAWKEAEELGHHWIGPDHFLLARLRRSDESTAAGVLSSCGLTHERFAEEVAQLVAASAVKDKDEKSTDRTSPLLNPAAYVMKRVPRNLRRGVCRGIVNHQDEVGEVLSVALPLAGQERSVLISGCERASSS